MNLFPVRQEPAPGGGWAVSKRGSGQPCHVLGGSRDHFAPLDPRPRRGQQQEPLSALPRLRRHYGNRTPRKSRSTQHHAQHAGDAPLLSMRD